MPTSTKVKNLNINELTEAQYDAAVQGGVIGANELSVLTDVSYVEPSDLATVATTGDYSDLINRPTNLVSTNTAQTISGAKTFSGDITLSGTTSIKNNTGGTNYTMLYRDASTIHVGGSTSVLKLEGSGTRPAYNSGSLALLSDITGGLPSQAGHSGEFLTTDGTDASWAAVDALPTQTGQSGKFLTTDGTDASWTTINALQNTATGREALTICGTVSTTEKAVNIGYQSSSANHGVAIGWKASATPEYSYATCHGVAVGRCANVSGGGIIAIGGDAKATANKAIAFGAGVTASATCAIQLGGVNKTNSDANTFKVGNNNGNYEIMSADGTIPTARLTKVNSTITLTAAGWSSNTQTVSVTGMTATGVVMVSPDPADQSAYTSAGILCTSQAAGTLTFSCDTVPSGDIDVNVVML